MQLELAGALDNLRVMPGGNEVGRQLLAVAPELAELEPVVADNTRIGRSPGQVFVGKVVDDAVEILLEIESIEGNVQQVGHAPRIACIKGTAAAFLVRSVVAFVLAMSAGAHEQA